MQEGQPLPSPGGAPPPATGCLDAAAATGNAATRVAGARPRFPPAHLREFALGEKTERQGKLAPVSPPLKLECGCDGRGSRRGTPRGHTNLGARGALVSATPNPHPHSRLRILGEGNLQPP